MANQSIFAAFERMWQHVVAALGNKADATHAHDDLYYTETEVDTKLSAVDASIDKITSGTTVVKEAEHAVSADTATNATNANHAATADNATNANSATKATQDGNGNVIAATYETVSNSDSKLAEAKSYTDTKTNGMATTTVVDNKISTHNTSTTAHSDIRDLITALSTKVNNFLDVDDTTTDELSEVLTLINNNKGTLESLTSSKVNVADIVDNLTTSNASKVLSAKQGVALKALIDELQAAVDGKVPVTRTINNKALSANITLSATDVGADAAGTAQTKADAALASAKSYADTQDAEILADAKEYTDTAELITVEDIDAIWGASIVAANATGVKF